MTFAIGLFLGFCLGILCMTLLFLASRAEAPVAGPASKPPEDHHTPHGIAGPSETAAAFSARD